MLYFLVLCLFAVQVVYGQFQCDSGSIDTVCYVASNRTFPSDTNITFSGQLHILPTYQILCTEVLTLSTNGGLVVEGRLVAAKLYISISGGSVNITRTGQISADELGYLPSLGPGFGTYDAGGGYGGNGGQGTQYSGTMPEGKPYGNPLVAGLPGSGGGKYLNSPWVIAGAGGGAIDIRTSETLIVDGTISSNGGMGGDGGAGSGGSIYLSAHSIICVFCNVNTSKITANGGNTKFNTNLNRGGGGAGGGGRIVISYDAVLALDVQITAFGGVAYSGAINNGGSGTIADLHTNTVYYISNAGSRATDFPDNIASNSSLVFINAKMQVNDTQATLSAPIKITNNSRITGTSLSLSNTAELFIDQSSTIDLIGNLTISGQKVVIDGIVWAQRINATTDRIVVSATGALTSDSRGYPPNTGPGAGFIVNQRYLGGAHGGDGGNGTITYGDYKFPVTMGSGSAGDRSRTGGSGGGAITIHAEVIYLEGRISSNGQSAYSGGAGGSVLINVTSLVCSNCSFSTVQANGAACKGGNSNGGGGRIAIYSKNITSNITFSAKSTVGRGCFDGTDGSMYLSTCLSSEGYVPDSHMKCVPCPSGQVVKGGRCTVCPAGTYSTGLGKCIACNAGQYSKDPGSSRCADCSAGYYANEPGLTHCYLCPLGHFSSPGSATCYACPAGSYGGYTGCVQCFSGTFTNTTGQTSCTDCPSGWYTPARGYANCISCHAGTYLPYKSASSCSWCSAGTISGDAATSCSECAPGSITTDRKSCFPCSAGNYSKNSQVCFACDAGTYSSEGAAKCTACEPGYYSAMSASNCTACSPGYYADTNSCQPCPLGYYSDVPTKQCTACPDGTYSQGGGNKNSCKACPPGAFQPSPTSACKPCSRGSFSNSSQATSSCLPCPPGYYSDQEGWLNCLPCPHGQIAALAGSPTCSACPSGYFSGTEGGSTCTPCPVGYFAYTTGTTTCSACPTGYYSNTTGSTHCSVCPIGSASTTDGSPACTACTSGYYSDDVGRPRCSPCPVGYYSNFTGSADCDVCPPGTNSTIGSASCFKVELIVPGKTGSGSNNAKAIAIPIIGVVVIGAVIVGLAYRRGMFKRNAKHIHEMKLIEPTDGTTE